MKTISREDMLAALEQVVDERGGDFRYQSPNRKQCVYEFEGEPSCGVGLALYKLGVPINTLSDMDRPGRISLSSTQVILRDAGFEMAESAIKVAWRFQFLQDSCKNYAHCLEEASRA